MCIDAVVFSNAHFGVGVGPVFLDHVGCNGNEDNLIDCSHRSSGSCRGHTDDVGVRCQGRYDFVLHVLNFISYLYMYLVMSYYKWNSHFHHCHIVHS